MPHGLDPMRRIQFLSLATCYSAAALRATPPTTGLSNAQSLTRWRGTLNTCKATTRAEDYHQPSEKNSPAPSSQAYASPSARAALQAARDRARKRRRQPRVVGQERQGQQYQQQHPSQQQRPHVTIKHLPNFLGSDFVPADPPSYLDHELDAHDKELIARLRRAVGSIAADVESIRDAEAEGASQG
ncbi:unnamed protein product, partial [Discosporangium mesarthrocarpum]